MDRVMELRRMFYCTVSLWPQLTMNKFVRVMYYELSLARTRSIRCNRANRIFIGAIDKDRTSKFLPRQRTNEIS